MGVVGGCWRLLGAVSAGKGGNFLVRERVVCHILSRGLVVVGAVSLSPHSVFGGRQLVEVFFASKRSTSHVDLAVACGRISAGGTATHGRSMNVNRWKEAGGTERDMTERDVEKYDGE